MRTKTTFIKDVLRNYILPGLRAKGSYVSVESIKNALAKQQRSVKPSTLNRYLVELVDDGFLFDAGRGWYSFLNNPAVLNNELVADLITEVRSTFPLLRFAAWSTAQFNPWLHHLVGQPVTILDVEKDAMNSVADHLEAKNWKVALNPRGNSAKRFAPQPRVVVLRVLHSAAPDAPGGYAVPEQSLVELRLEVEALSLLSVDEYRKMTTRMVGGQRVSIATLLRYAAKRRLTPEAIFENQLSALF